jgi:glycosyltransferase involved in cell wall biosynthesis
MKPVILTFTSFYLPGYLGGGPIRTIANMVERLGDDFDFRIVTTDRDAGDSTPYLGVKVDAWNVVGKAQVFYASKSSLSWWGLARLIRENKHDFLYLNSFFDVRFSIKPLLLHRFIFSKTCSVIIAPRGEFSLGAIQLKSWKKLPFVLLMRIFRIYNEIIWHASTSLEVSDISRVMGAKPTLCRVAPNMTEMSCPSHYSFSLPSISLHQVETEIGNEPLRVCFLSRISSKKNLDFALKVLSDVCVPVQFDIYGPQESLSYWKICQQLISGLPPNISVFYAGTVEHAQVCYTIAKYEIFFLPTRGENFGHVFIESWMAGVPVLISDQTPWRGLMQKNLGWDFSLDKPSEFVKVLNMFDKRNKVERIAVRQSCLEFAREQVEGTEALILNRRLFLSSLHTIDKDNSNNF